MPPAPLTGSTLASGGSVLELARTGSVWHGGISWSLLTASTPAATLLAKPCHVNPIHRSGGGVLLQYTPFPLTFTCVCHYHSISNNQEKISLVIKKTVCGHCCFDFKKWCFLQIWNSWLSKSPTTYFSVSPLVLSCSACKWFHNPLFSMFPLGRRWK